MRKTVNEPVEFRGTGLHTGEDCRLRVSPGSEGIIFLKNGVEIPALVDYKSGDRRGTSLSNRGETVHTVEHLLSALYGAGITDCHIEFISGGEVPIYDGSARTFAEAFADNIRVLEKENEYLFISDGYTYQEGDVLISWHDDCGNSFFVDFTYDGSKFGMGKQSCRVEVKMSTYPSLIAPARTFGFYEEVEALKKAGLAMGGSLDNALVIRDGKPLNGSYRMENELAMHKILDFVGDMALSGKRLRGRFEVVKSGHRHNTEFLKSLMEV